MGTLDSLRTLKSLFPRKWKQAHVHNPSPSFKLNIFSAKRSNSTAKGPVFVSSEQSSKAMKILLGAVGISLMSFVEPSHAAQSPIFSEPSNALSLPTWAVHVSSVVEWATAMGLVWQYGEKSGYESWKGLSWGMVPLLGGALCACTWHFFYNSESLEVLVALQAALTVIGNATMCIAAYRIYASSKEGPKNP